MRKIFPLILGLLLSFFSYHVLVAQCINAPPGLISWLPADGNTDDIIGSNDGVIIDGVTFVPGMVDEAFSFDGINDLVSIPPDPSLPELNESRTIDMWVFTRPTSWDFDQNTIFYSGALGGFGIFALDMHTFPEMQFFAFGHEIEFDAGVPLEGWVHVAVTYDNTTQRVDVYTQGVLRTGAAPASPSPLNTTPGNPFLIGTAGPPFNDFFDGLIDEVEIFDRALSATEIQDIFNAGAAGKCKCSTSNIFFTNGVSSISYLGGPKGVSISIENTGTSDITGLAIDDIANTSFEPSEFTIIDIIPDPTTTTIIPGETIEFTVFGTFNTTLHMDDLYEQCFRISTDDDCIDDTLCFETNVIIGCPVSIGSNIIDCNENSVGGQNFVLPVTVHNVFPNIEDIEFEFVFNPAFLTVNGIVPNPSFGVITLDPPVAGKISGTVSYAAVLPDGVVDFKAGGGVNPVITDALFSIDVTTVEQPPGRCVIQIGSSKFIFNSTTIAAPLPRPVDPGNIFLRGDSCNCDEPNPNFTILPGNVVLEGEEVTLVADDNSIHLWIPDTDDGQLLGSGDQVVTVVYDKAGTFTISHTIISDNGASATATKEITVLPRACATPPEGMVAWLPGDNNVDELISGNDGIFMNGTTFGTGMVDEAFSFDGVDDWVRIPSSPSLPSGAEPRTIDLWIFTTTNSWAVDQNTVFNTGTPGNNTKSSFSLDMHLFPNMQFFGFGNDLFFNPGVPLEGWVHIAITLDTTNTLTIYSQGVQVAQQTFALPYNTTVADYQLGIGPFGAFFDGLIDEFEVFDRALDPSEVLAIFETGAGGKCKDGSTACDPGSDVSICAGDNVILNAAQGCGIDLDGSAGCTTASPFDCSTACTSTLSSGDAGNLFVNSGEQICIPEGTTVTGTISLNGGTLIICGSANFTTFNLWAGELVVNGEATFADLTNNSATISNYGEITVTGTFINNLTINNFGVFTVLEAITHNNGVMTFGPGSLMEAQNFTNNSTITADTSVCSQIKISNNTILNSSSITGKVDICDSNGIETNTATLGPLVTTDCSCITPDPDDCGLTYTWLPASGLNSTTIGSPIASPDSTTTYTVIVSDGIDTQIGEVTVTVLNAPAVGPISGDTLICFGEDGLVYSVPDLGAGTYTWTASGPTDAITPAGASATYDFADAFANGQTVNVEFTDVNGCTSSDELVISTEDCGGGTGIQGPTTVCKNQGGYVYTIALDPNATSHQWWINVSATIVPLSGSNTVTIAFGDFFTTATLTVGRNLSVAPWWVTESIVITGENCGAKIANPNSSSSLETGLTVLGSPNPFVDHTNVTISGDEEFVNVIVTDAQGRQVSAEVVSNNQTIEVGTDLSAGVYILRVSDSKNSEVIRIIKVN